MARSLARALGYTYLDTGAMYRALTLKALEHGVDLRDGELLAELLDHTRLELKSDGTVWVDTAEVSHRLRTPEVDAAVSVVASVPAVREHMVRRQRELAAAGGVVLDGRDTGSYVLPTAEVKFYLTASLEERAARRGRELAERGYPIAQEELAREIARRDELDRSRPLGPLTIPAGAQVVDSTGRSAEAILEEMVAHCRRRLARL
ncbi:MAG: (d)CMP kinase [Thermaerobacter sp.]|nr:(d)CMP kinase [Thermaerobacter sp.]MDA8146279.1 (d)CMP kinase [Thermaerobacter sp.]